MCFMHEKIEEYLAWKSSHRMFAGDRYKHWLYRFVEACGEKEIEEYSSSDIVVYHNWMTQRFSHTSIRYAMSIIKNFFLFFKMKNYNCISPQLIQLPRKQKANSHRALTEEEFARLNKVINPNSFHTMRDLLILRLLWETGMRVSELCDLNLNDIEDKNSKAVVSTKKTSNMRVVVWSARTQELLSKYIAMRTDLKGCESPALFVGTKGKGFWSKRLTTRTVQRMLKEYCTRAGITAKTTPHGFRHGWAHFRRDKGAPLPFIQRGLGHVSPMSSFVYQQYSDPEFELSARAYLC